MTALRGVRSSPVVSSYLSCPNIMHINIITIPLPLCITSLDG